MPESYIKTFSLAVLAALWAYSCPVYGVQGPSEADRRLPGGEHPAGELLFMPPFDKEGSVQPKPAWYLKTGAKKGITEDAATEEERFAAADIAVLDQGFSSAWPGILAGFEEPWVMAEPWDAAVMGKTKPVLIIPSGGLYGLSDSEFFKAGLAEFVRSGGTILCLSQFSGLDYSALPAPEGSGIKAVGWSEDHGPLFRASTVQPRQPVLSSKIKLTPDVETDGYFTAYPENSRIVLSRPDGFPTFIAYPFGEGWVAATTLFPEFLNNIGLMGPDEKAVLLEAIAWAKGPKQAPQPGESKPAAAHRQPLSAFPARPEVVHSLEMKGDRIILKLEISPIPALSGQDFFVRALGSEKYFRLAKDKVVLSFDGPYKDADKSLAFALYHSSGRALVRVVIPLAASSGTGVALDKSHYTPGQSALATISGLGSGEFNYTAPGHQDTLYLSGNGMAKFTIPAGVPTGEYKLAWDMLKQDGSSKRGEVPIFVAGAGVKIQGVAIQRKQEKDAVSAQAGFRIKSSEKLTARLNVRLRSPDGKTAEVLESEITLKRGIQDIPVPFSFKPSTAGIWEMTYGLYVAAPQAPGLPLEPALAAPGRKLFDVGSAAVLGTFTDKPLYFEPSGEVKVSSLIYGKGKFRMEIYLDGDRIAKEKTVLSGPYMFNAVMPRLGPGMHRIRTVVAAGDKLESSEEHTFTYGLRQPDLVASIKAPQPAGMSLPVGIGITNYGKKASGPCRAALYEGDPAKGGVLIAKADVPPLDPGMQHVVIFEWPLAKKAGMRTLFAVADPENAVNETDKRNNTASAEIKVPDVLLTLTTVKDSFTTDESVPLAIYMANFSGKSYKSIGLRTQMTGSGGRVVFSESSTMREIAPGTDRRIDRPVSLASLPVGAYTLNVELSKDKTLASGLAVINALPTLLLSGALEGSHKAASLCRPFAIKYDVKSAGNIPATTGSVKIDIRDARTGAPAFSRQVPLSDRQDVITIEKPDMPKGDYIISLRASAANQQHGIVRDFVLAEQPLVISGPIVVRKAAASVPRILVWYDRPGTAVDQAMGDAVISNAFDQQPIYYKVASRPDEFRQQAASGVFNAFVLFEPDAITDDLEWLREMAAGGRGIVIIGEGDRARAAAEAFGFSFDRPLAESDRMISLSSDSGLALSGTFAVSSRVLAPRKKGSRPLAYIAGADQPAALVDSTGRGRILLLPFSIIHSARDAGTSGIYSLLLRSASMSVAPESDEPGGVTAGEIQASSFTERTKAQIRETLPPGSAVLWTSANGDAKGNVIMYEITVDAEPQRLLYIYRPSAGGAGRTVTEAFYECEGKWTSQGKVE